MQMIELVNWVSEPKAWIALATLVALETVLGVDNVIFISILSGRLPAEKRDRARRLGLTIAALTRVLLLLGISWLVGATNPLFSLPQWLGNLLQSASPGGGQEFTEISPRDLILFGGGLFLIWKSAKEMGHSLDGSGSDQNGATKITAGFGATLVQIALLDIVFSFDSVLTAVGMADRIGVMILAVLISVAIMLVASGSIARFVDKHPSIKILALAFLILIGVTLLAEGLAFHISKGYIYFAMIFALAVNLVQLRQKRQPVKLHPQTKNIEYCDPNK